MHRGTRLTLFLLWVTICVFTNGTALAARHWFTETDRVLVKTDLFEAAASVNDYCDTGEELRLNVRFFTEDEFEVGDNAGYRELVLTQIAPAARAFCGDLDQLEIHNYFAVPFKNTYGNEIPASTATFLHPFVDGYPVEIQWNWFDSIYSGQFVPGGSDRFGDDDLTTVSAIRAWLAKGSAEELIASEKEDRERRRAAAASEEGSPCGVVPTRYREREFGPLLYALEHHCAESLGVHEQLFVAGLSKSILSKCELPADPESRRTVEDFLASSEWAAIGGRERNNPDLGEALEDQATGLTAYGAGAGAFKAVGCESPLIPILVAGIVKYLTGTAAGPEGAKGPLWVLGCAAHYDGTYSQEQCQCAADAARAIYPGIHSWRFSPRHLENLIQRNPLVGARATLGCGIARY